MWNVMDLFTQSPRNERVLRRIALIASYCLFANVSPLPACFRNLKLILSGTGELIKDEIGGCDGMWVWIPNMETVNVVEPNCCMDGSFEDAPTSHRSAKHLLGLAEVN